MCLSDLFWFSERYEAEHLVPSLFGGNKNSVPFIKEQAKAEQLVPFYTLGTIRSAA
jgi:hypothetical protein